MKQYDCKNSSLSAGINIMTKKPIEPRVFPPSVTQLDEAQERVYNAITSGPRGEVVGPLGVWLWRPELADRAQRLGEYARYNTKLPPKLSELAILVVARFWGSEFEWCVHKKIALEAGLNPEVVEAIRVGKAPSLEEQNQVVVYEFSRTLLEQRAVNDDLYERAIEVLGQETTIDLVAILGYYSLISLTINAFRVSLPEGSEPEL
jgi:4-carboxymuconolactone decarboxylase